MPINITQLIIIILFARRLHSANLSLMKSIVRIVTIIYEYKIGNWPPRSCGITLTDYFLCGYVKSQVSADKPHTLNYLEVNVRRVIGEISTQRCWKECLKM